jgi:hypothetical protein
MWNPYIPYCNMIFLYSYMYFTIIDINGCFFSIVCLLKFFLFLLIIYHNYNNQFNGCRSIIKFLALVGLRVNTLFVFPSRAIVLSLFYSILRKRTFPNYTYGWNFEKMELCHVWKVEMRWHICSLCNIQKLERKNCCNFLKHCLCER